MPLDQMITFFACPKPFIVRCAEKTEPGAEV